MMTILTGIAAGAVHVVSGPDHLAAMAPIAAHDPGRAARFGLKWGLGHGLGAGFVGLLGVAARDQLNIASIAAWSEFAVGFMLIGIGVWAFWQARGMVIHGHAHVHEAHAAHEAEGDPQTHQQAHQHLHVHAKGVHKPEDPQAAHAHSHAPLLIGALHGSAGSGHALAVLPSLALPTGQALAYLGAYFCAAVAAMGAFGGLLGLVARSQRPETLRLLMYGSSLAAVAVGVFWVAANA